MIDPGTRIVCPNCKLHVATAIAPVELDDGELYDDLFDWHVNVTSTACPKCLANFGDSGGWLHTDNGWEEV